MHNGSLIIIGLVAFILIVTIPLTYNILTQSSAEGAPELVILPQAGDQCVRDTDYMRTNHMDLLNDWRDEVVRQGDRFTEGPHGSQIEKSLSNTCLDCHSNKEQFCNECHNYMAVDPYCWDCHTIPDETAQPQMAVTPKPAEEN